MNNACIALQVFRDTPPIVLVKGFATVEDCEKLSPVRINNPPRINQPPLPKKKNVI